MTQIPRPAQPRRVDSQPYVDICAFWLKTWEIMKPQRAFYARTGYRFMCLVLSKLIEQQVFVNSSHVIIIWTHICYRTRIYMSHDFYLQPSRLPVRLVIVCKLTPAYFDKLRNIYSSSYQESCILTALQQQTDCIILSEVLKLTLYHNSVIQCLVETSTAFRISVIQLLP